MDRSGSAARTAALLIRKVMVLRGWTERGEDVAQAVYNVLE
ncbi:MAG: hypothetical protein M5R41_04525 [Bacteroidia bacterium]|nr:hypothetical protein [Bacteroidia bacterium]